LKTKLIAFIAVLVAAAAVAGPGMASSRDHNRDQIPDKWEKRFHLSLKVDQSGRDQDRDGADNICEFQSGDSPRDADTNDDGVADQHEADEMECEADEPQGEDHGGHHPGPGGGAEDHSGHGHGGSDDGPNHT